MAGVECGQCGTRIIAAFGSEHVSEHCIRNFWSCEACGCEFETEVRFAPLSAIQSPDDAREL